MRIGKRCSSYRGNRGNTYLEVVPFSFVTNGAVYLIKYDDIKRVLFDSFISLF